MEAGLRKAAEGGTRLGCRAGVGGALGGREPGRREPGLEWKCWLERMNLNLGMSAWAVIGRAQGKAAPGETVVKRSSVSRPGIPGSQLVLGWKSEVVGCASQLGE